MTSGLWLGNGAKTTIQQPHKVLDFLRSLPMWSKGPNDKAYFVSLVSVERDQILV